MTTTYSLDIIETHHVIRTPAGDVAHAVPRRRVAQLVADGYMSDDRDAFGLTMSLTMARVISPGSRIVLSDATAQR